MADTTPAPVTIKRKMEQVIEHWYESADIRPLLIRGARRVGKTHLIDVCGNRLCPEGYVKLDFQTNLPAMEHIFATNTDDTDRIMSRISEYVRRPLKPESSLVFFDEVQLCEEALNSLRFFSGTLWRVIASGSLLGVTTKARSLPFPSGVLQKDLHPLDFEEFLCACGQAHMAYAIREHATTLEPYILHDEAIEYYRRYCVVGGMPRPCTRYLETGSMESVEEELNEIDRTYTADMTDPQNGISGISAKRIWDSLPAQLTRASTKKFKYSDVVRGGRRAHLLEPLEWLAAAGIVTINAMTHDTQAPLSAFNEEDGSFFKVYVADTGIMFRKFGVDPALFTGGAVAAVLSADFRSAIAENYVMQALRANDIRTFYWTPDRSGARGELDFVIQTRSAQVIPMEVKSGRNVSAKNLRRFMETARSPYAVIFSENNFGRTGGEGDNASEIRHLPLYAAFTMDDALVGSSPGDK